MKKIVLSALLIGLLTACSDDNDSKKSLTGKWQAIKGEEYVNNNLEDSEVLEQDNNSCPDYTEFMADGKMLSIDMDANCEKEDESLGAYTFDGNNLKVSIEGENETYKVASLTATEFVLEFDYTEEGVTYKNKVYFKKLK